MGRLAATRTLSAGGMLALSCLRPVLVVFGVNLLPRVRAAAVGGAGVLPVPRARRCRPAPAAGRLRGRISAVPPDARGRVPGWAA